MLIIPAIDLKDHKVVRLKKGKMGEATIYSNDPLQIAEKWVEQGAERLHLVDLNGAFEGQPVHFKEIQEIAKKYPQIKIEIGGGVRSMDVIQKYFDHGVQFCILGTAAIKDPELVFASCEKFSHQIILGIDAKEGMVATDGWGQKSETKALEVAHHFKECAIESVIYTDIAKDGMLSGMNFEQIKQMQACSFPLIASGGLTSLQDIDQLVALGNIHGVIAGKAIYEGNFSLKEAIRRGAVSASGN